MGEHMNVRLQTALVAGIVVFTLFIFSLLIKKKLNLKYTLLWLLMIFTMLLAALMPKTIDKVSKIMGFLTPSNFIFVISGMFTLLILVSMTAITSHMNKRIFKLVQQQALLEKKIREMETKLQDYGSNNDGNSI